MTNTEQILLSRLDPPRVGYGTWIAANVVMTKKERIRIGNHCRIDDFVKLEGGDDLIMGNHIHIASFAHLNIGGGKLFLGDRTAFASGARIITGGNRPDGQSMSATAPRELQLVLPGSVVIEEDACVLTNAVVLPNCNMGRGSRLAAGSVLTKTLPPFEIWAGVPAKKIGEVPRVNAKETSE
jgi:acetyltransferase-like isoleucine patch superfamily enzyme